MSFAETEMRELLTTHKNYWNSITTSILWHLTLFNNNLSGLECLIVVLYTATMTNPFLLDSVWQFLEISICESVAFMPTRPELDRCMSCDSNCYGPRHISLQERHRYQWDQTQSDTVRHSTGVKYPYGWSEPGRAEIKLTLSASRCGFANSLAAVGKPC